MQEERRARIRELLGSAVPGSGMGGVSVPVTLVINVSVGRVFKKSREYHEA